MLLLPVAATDGKQGLGRRGRAHGGMTGDRKEQPLRNGRLAPVPVLIFVSVYCAVRLVWERYWGGHRVAVERWRVEAAKTNYDDDAKSILRHGTA